MTSQSSPSSPFSSYCDSQHLATIIFLLSAFSLPVRSNTPPQLKNPGVLIVLEDSSIGTTIGNLTAVDRDGPEPLQFRDTDTDVMANHLVRLSESRKIDDITWIVDIILNRKLDRDFEPSERKLYFLIDDGTSEIPARISLFIKDVNDEKPQFKNLPYKPVVSESVVPGSVVFRGVKAHDPDNGRGGTITYSLETDAQAADEEYRTTFVINPQTGVITVNKSLDYEKHNYYQFKIKAVDGGGLEGVPADLLIEVIDVQDTPPYFVNLPYSVEVDENVTVGTEIHQVSGIDGDRGIPNSLVYRFVTGVDANFNIDENTGWITVKSPLDRDDPLVRNRGGVYAMFVEASEVIPAGQVNNGQTSAATLVTITVRDINDNAPTFSSNNYDATILENMQDNVPITFVGGVMRVADADQGTNSHFTLSIEQNGQPFQEFSTVPQEIFSESTVLIRVNSSQNLDYEQKKTIIFQVVAREMDTHERRSSTATVTLHIEDMNDNVPVFTNDTYQLFVREDAPINSSIITLKATDEDSGVFGEVSYSIRGGNKRFRIDNATGTIYVAAALDREETDDYYLTAEARDGGGMRTPAEVTIIVLDVNDNAPQFRRKEYEATVREGDGDFLRPLILEAIDDDEPDTVNSEVHYRISQVTIGLESNFSINELTGHITLTQPLDYEKLDSAIGGQVTLQVQAFDMGHTPLVTSVSVSITVEDMNDNTPSFRQSMYHKMIPENATQGSKILNVNAFDLDGTSPNNDFIYRIESGALDKFRMDFATGDIFVETGTRLDRETKNIYTMNISAIDKGTPPQTGHAVVVIQLTDVNDEVPVFQLQRMSITIQENAEINSMVTMLLAEDPDTNADLDYSVVLVKAYDDRNEEVDIVDNNLTNYFGIVHSNGSIFVASKLDREKAERYILKITVQDLNAWYPHDQTAEQTATATLTVTLEDYNDNAPIFKPSNIYRANISEGQDIDSEALRVETFDPDKNQIVTYKIENAETSSFKIDSSTGIIYVKKKLDREAQTDLTFVVIATDNGQPAMSSSARIIVRLLDINDNNPQFPLHPSEYNVSEDADVGHVVAVITGTDADEGDFSFLFYTLSGVDNDGTFSVGENTGEIIVQKGLDRERKMSYTLDVVAWDNKKDPSNRRSNRTAIKINIGDVNDNAPQFTAIGFQSIPESSPLGTSVYKVVANDADFGENATVEYSLGDDTNATNSRNERIFSIGKTSGMIYVKSDLHNMVGVRYITVFATDKGIEPLSNSTVVYLEVLDVNDDAPRFVMPDPNNPVVVIEEDQPPGTPIITLIANDDDFGRNGEVVYTLVQTESRLDWKKFSLNKLTGLLTNRVVLDRESQEFHELLVRATDRGLPRNYSTDLTLTVRVLDVNDQPPRFDRSKYKTPYPVEVVEESSIACAGNVGIAVDDDINLNFTIICYYLWAVELEDTFTLDKSGKLCVKRNLNREEQAYTYVIILASPYCYEEVTPKIFTRPPFILSPPLSVYDHSNHTLLWVNVTIGDINDNAPQFHHKDLALGVTRNTQFGRIILELKTEASDADTAKWGIDIFNTTGPVEVRPDSLQDQLVEMGITQPFLFFPNGSVKTNTYFKPNMYGFFRVPIMVRDKGGLTDTATLRISLINDDQRLRVVFRRRLEAVYIQQEGEEGAVKDTFPLRLRNVTGFRIVVDKIQTHQNDLGKPEYEKTDMLIHGEDPQTDEVIPAEQLLKSIDLHAEFMIGILNDYNIARIEPTSSGGVDDSVEKELKMAVILLSVILGMIIVVLAATFYTSRKKFKRKLKAATAMAYAQKGEGSQESDLYKLEMPGTNIHSYENGTKFTSQQNNTGANPIYLEKIMLDHADDDGINSLDENAIDHNRPYDEQEVSMNIFPEDRETMQTQRMKDLYLKAALNEHETSRNLKNHDMSKKFQNGNGKLKITNGHAHVLEGEVVTTRNIDGLQTTEI